MGKELGWGVEACGVGLGKRVGAQYTEYNIECCIYCFNSDGLDDDDVVKLLLQVIINAFKLVGTGSEAENVRCRWGK